jgi:hypothetical protein
MLKLRRAIVLDAGPPEQGPEQRLLVELSGADEPPGRPPAKPPRRAPGGPGAGGDSRPAIADVSLVGRAEVGDELIVNAQALDLGLGSGGFDIVHVNLTRGLSGGCASEAKAMKLNYTSLQHAVEPVEDQELRVPVERPVGVLALHGQLAAAAWAFAQGAPGARLGYVQTEGGALPGGHSHTVRALRERGLLAGHLTAGAAFGGEGEAISTAGALHHGLRALGWDAALCGPGPGIVGSASPLGHGGMAALDSAHAALALGAPTLLVARMSSGDDRARHRGISHHTLTVLDLLLAPVIVTLPVGVRPPAGVRAPTSVDAPASADAPTGADAPVSVDAPLRPGHDWRHATVDLAAYAAAGLPAHTMGRGLTEDPLFFASALAAGATLAELSARSHAR